MRRRTGDPTAVWAILAGGSSAWQAARHLVALGASHVPNVPSSPRAPCNLQLRIILKVAQLSLFPASEGPCRGERAARGNYPARGA